jgi:hypothetical protein
MGSSKSFTASWKGGRPAFIFFPIIQYVIIYCRLEYRFSILYRQNADAIVDHYQGSSPYLGT